MMDNVLFQEAPLFSEVYELKKSDHDSYSKLQKKIREQEFYHVYCPHESFRSALFVRALKAEQKIGFKKWWNFWIFDQRFTRDLSLPDAIRQLSLARTEIPDWDERLQHIRANSSESAQGLQQVPEWASLQIELTKNSSYDLTVMKPYICIFPGSVWDTKRWTTEGFTDLVKKLDRSHSVVLMGSSNERDLCEKIRNQNERVLNLAGHLSLTQSLHILKDAFLCISNDSGGQHMAAAVGTPVISIFGPTTLDLGYRPWISKAVVVENRNIKCRPCGKHGHKKCPIGTHECMTSITAQDVLQGLITLNSKF
jgi:heptosyltransferase-2